jgi:FAD:protein FMN transferase
MKYIGIILVLIGAFSSSVSAQSNKSHKEVLLLMGSRFELTAVSENEALAKKAIHAGIAEIKRIESLISSWDSNSQTSSVIRNAGIKPVKVDQELFNLIRRSIKISNLTHGAFDISYASMDKIWKFDGSMKVMPDSASVKASVSKINYENIILDWKIGISNPKNKDQIYSWLTIGETAVVTSGNYEKFVEFDGVKYSHIIDPRSGYPVKGLSSVTIICPNAELADALATSVFVLGKEKGLELINQLKGIECILVTDDQKLITSTNLKLEYHNIKNQKSKYQIQIGETNEK